MGAMQRFLLWITLIIVPHHLLAVEDIKILGLFTNKVLMSLDGQRKLLKVGEKFDNVELISANSKNCTVRVGEKVQTLTLGSDISVKFKKPGTPTLRIPKDEQGMYRVTGKINDQSVKFLVDTGATQLAMNKNQAASLKIDFKKGNAVEVDTASGKAKAYQVTIRKVTVGEITLYDIPALVVSGDAPYEVLLGMSFLKRVDMDEDNSVLEMKQKY